MRDPLTGREEEVARVLDALASGSRRILVMGEAGVGKSALVERALGERAEVSYCSLAASETGDADIEQLVGSLPDDAIFVLDDIEELDAEAARRLDAMITARARQVVFVGRSRWPIDVDVLLTIGPLAADASASLFVEEARKHKPDFMPRDEQSIRELVEQLDHNPLAIELAAARVRTLAPAEILRRLPERLKLLRRRGSGDPRHQSMEAALSPSWERLAVSERELLSQATIFARAFSLEAAEAVIELSEDEWLIDVLEALVDQSMLSSHERDGATLFSMSRSVRAFARSRGARDLDGALKRHAVYFIERSVGWVERSEQDASAARALFAARAEFEAIHARSARASRTALLCVSRIARADIIRGASDADLSMLDDAIDGAGADALLPELYASRARLRASAGELDGAASDFEVWCEMASTSSARVEAELELGILERRRGNIERAATLLGACVDRAKRDGVREQERVASAHLACVYADRGELERARVLVDEVMELPRCASLRRECDVLKRLAYVHFFLGNIAEQRALNVSALEVARELGDQRLIARCLQGLGDSAFAHQELDEAIAYYEEAAAALEQLGEQYLLGVLLGNLGAARHRADQLVLAERAYRGALALHRQVGSRPYEAIVLYALGVLQHEQDRREDARLHYERAIAVHMELEQEDDAASVRLASALLWAERGELDEARAVATLALEALGEWPAWSSLASGVLAIISASAGSRREASLRVDEALGQAREKRPTHVHVGVLELIKHKIEEGAGQVIDVEALSRRSLLARVLRRWSLDGAGAAPEITIGEGGAWFQIAGEAVVDMRRRRAPRRILAGLLERWSSGSSLDVFDAFEVGYPGETIDVDSAANRIYWVIGELRKLGLGPFIVTDEDGYRLDGSRRVAVGGKELPKENQ